MQRRKTVKAKGDELFHIFPIQDVTIYGVPAVEQDVTEDEWLRLNEYQPSAFVCDPLPAEPVQAPKEGAKNG